jgi:esterase/lipase
MLADSLGANLFYTRLAGHGRDAAAMGEATVEDWLHDVAEAMAVGERLGDRVVLVGTSTGGTLALWAAGRASWRERIAALVLVSPNLALKDPRARMLLWPWGGVLARVVVGKERCFHPVNPRQARHWTTCYPTGALLPMMALVEHVRSMDPRTVSAPLFVAYSPEDEVVDEKESHRVMASLASRAKRFMVVAGSGDPEHHVIAGNITSPATTDTVVAAALDFLRGVEEGDGR